MSEIYLATWLDACERDREVEKVINAQAPHSSFIPRECPLPPTPPSKPLKIQQLSPIKIKDWQRHGLCYNCDEKLVQRFLMGKMYPTVNGG